MVPVIIVSGSMGIFSDGKGDLQDIGDKLGWFITANIWGKYKDGVSLLQQLQREMHQCHLHLDFNSSV